MYVAEFLCSPTLPDALARALAHRMPINDDVTIDQTGAVQLVGHPGIDLTFWLEHLDSRSCAQATAARWVARLSADELVTYLTAERSPDMWVAAISARPDLVAPLLPRARPDALAAVCADSYQSIRARDRVTALTLLDPTGPAPLHSSTVELLALDAAQDDAALNLPRLLTWLREAGDRYTATADVHVAVGTPLPATAPIDVAKEQSWLSRIDLPPAHVAAWLMGAADLPEAVLAVGLHYRGSIDDVIELATSALPLERRPELARAVWTHLTFSNRMVLALTAYQAEGKATRSIDVNTARRQDLPRLVELIRASGDDVPWRWRSQLLGRQDVPAELLPDLVEYASPYADDDTIAVLTHPAAPADLLAKTATWLAACPDDDDPVLYAVAVAMTTGDLAPLRTLPMAHLVEVLSEVPHGRATFAQIAAPLLAGAHDEGRADVLARLLVGDSVDKVSVNDLCDTVAGIAAP